MGGLSKKGFQFDKIATAAASPHLTLDAGALLFKHSTINPRQEEQEKMTAKAIVEAYNLIGYDAVGVGSQDLIAGVPYLQALSREAKFAWLSANLVSNKTKKQIFKASISVKLGTIRAGVIGLTGAAMLSASDDAIIQPWEQVLPALVAKLAKKNDLLILLSNLPPADNQRIAETLPALHLIIQSGASANTISPEPINNTIMASTAPQGKQVGIMEINWQPGGRWGDAKTAVRAQKQASLDQLLGELSKYPPDQDPETALRNQPEQLQTYRNLRAQEQALRGEIDLLDKTIGPATPRVAPSTHTNRFLAMEKELPDHPEVASLVGELEGAVNRLGQRQAKAATLQSNSPYLGFRGCAPCHASQMASWQQTKHAQAYATLAQGKKQFDQSCLPCHVTGVAVSQAAEALALPDDRLGVGCETCHGPGRLHSASPQTNPLPRKPGAEICQTCHQPPHDQDFHYDQQLKKVGHH